MTCKPVAFEMFEPASDMKWVRCQECGKAVNRYDKPVSEMLTFGSATDKPETMTHWCYVQCKCGKAKIKVYGKMGMQYGIGCTIEENI